MTAATKITLSTGDTYYHAEDFCRAMGTRDGLESVSVGDQGREALAWFASEEGWEPTESDLAKAAAAFETVYS